MNMMRSKVSLSFRRTLMTAPFSRILAMLLLIFGGVLNAAACEKDTSSASIKALLLGKIDKQRENFVEFISTGKNFSHSKSHGFAKFWKVNWEAQQEWCGEIVKALARQSADFKSPTDIHSIETHVETWSADSGVGFMRRQNGWVDIKPTSVVTATIRFPNLDSSASRQRSTKQEAGVAVTARLMGTPPYSQVFPDYLYNIPVKGRPQYGLKGGLPQDPTQRGLLKVPDKPDGSNIGSLPWGDYGMPITYDYSHVALVSYRGEPLFIEYGVYPKDIIDGFSWEKPSKKEVDQARWGYAGQGYVLINGINKNLFASDWVLSEPPFPLDHGARPLLGVVIGSGNDATATAVPPWRSDYLYACIVNFDIMRK